MRVGKSSKAGKPDGVPQVLGNLRTLIGALDRFCGPLPPIPEMATLAQVKEFCELLCSPVHPWKGQLVGGRLWTVGHSLFLFRKTLPSEADPGKACRDYLKRMSKDNDLPSPDFLAFIRKEIPRIFTPGWDRSYRSRARGTLLPVTACYQAGRRRGGARLLKGCLSRVRRVALGYEVFDEPVRCRVTAIRDGPKLRVVSASGWQQNALSPLHHLWYDKLSTMPWLVRGDAKATTFKGMEAVEGEQFVSGDYQSATDDFNIHIYREVLKAIEKTSVHVPASVWATAQSMSASRMEWKTWHRVQRRGQLMGNFLSFPSLCLVNYLTFKYLVRRDVPVFINGDDIVFRATSQETKEWMDGVASCGLTLSRGKTLVDGKFFTLNSALFRSGRQVRSHPYIRSKAWFSKPDDPSALCGQFSKLTVGFNGWKRREVQVDFLRRHKRVVLLAQRSLARGLRLRVADSVIRKSGLWKRERFYLSLDHESALPSSGSAVSGFRTLSKRDVPRRSWRQRDLHAMSERQAFRISSQDPTGLPSNSSDDYLRRLREGTQRPWLPRLMKCYKRFIGRNFAFRRNQVDNGPQARFAVENAGEHAGVGWCGIQDLG